MIYLPQTLYHNYSCPKPKYPIVRYLDPQEEGWFRGEGRGDTGA